MSFNLKHSSVLAAILLIGCGGGGGDSSPTTPPVADTTAPTIEISASGLTVDAGDDLQFDVTATDASGFGTTNVTCTQGAVNTSISTTSETQTAVTTFGAPATAGTVNCTATSTDSAGNAANLDFSITVNPFAVNRANFNGTWFGPCHNNTFGFSVRQTITIDGTSLVSGLESFTAGSIPSPNCVLPGGLGILIETDSTATLDFQSDINLGGCINGRGVETNIDVLTVDTSGNETATTDQLIDDTLNFVTGFIDVLPDTTNICQLTNNNLMFAGVEYTGDTNPTVIIPTFDITSDVAWSLDDNNYIGGTSSSSQNADDNLGVLVVSTVDDMENGDFSGSEVSFTHTLQGSGVYRVTTTAEVAGADPAEPTAKFLSLSASVGTDVGTNSTTYVSEENDGFVIVVVDEGGLYHFSTARARIDRAIEVDGGVPDAPSRIDIGMTNLFDFQN